MFHLLPSLYTVLMSVEKRFASTSDWQGSKQGLSLDRAALSSSLRKTNCPSLCKANKDNIISHMTLIRIASSHHHITPLAPLPTPSSPPARQRHIHKGHQNKIALPAGCFQLVCQYRREAHQINVFYKIKRRSLISAHAKSMNINS